MRYFNNFYRLISRQNISDIRLARYLRPPRKVWIRRDATVSPSNFFSSLHSDSYGRMPRPWLFWTKITDTGTPLFPSLQNPCERCLILTLLSWKQWPPNSLRSHICIELGWTLLFPLPFLPIFNLKFSLIPTFAVGFVPSLCHFFKLWWSVLLPRNLLLPGFPYTDVVEPLFSIPFSPVLYLFFYYLVSVPNLFWVDLALHCLAPFLGFHFQLYRMWYNSPSLVLRKMYSVLW